ncbi:hypothetical protein D3C81_1998830 [compost metagenome]
MAERRVVMTQHHRAPGSDVIDVGFTIDVIQIRAICFFDKQRSTTHAGKGANRGVNAAGDQFACCAVEVLRLTHGWGPGS